MTEKTQKDITLIYLHSYATHTMLIEKYIFKRVKNRSCSVLSLKSVKLTLGSTEREYKHIMMA